MRNGNVTAAVRGAIGQLFTYRYFWYPADAQPRLVALFSEPIGNAYAELLSQLQIGSVWRDGKGWGGSGPEVGDELT